MPPCAELPYAQNHFSAQIGPMPSLMLSGSVSSRPQQEQDENRRPYALAAARGSAAAARMRDSCSSVQDGNRMNLPLAMRPSLTSPSVTRMAASHLPLAGMSRNWKVSSRSL